MNSKEKYNKLKKIFEDNENKDNAISMAAYMQDNFHFYGIEAPKRKLLYKEIIANDKKDKVLDWNLLKLCYEDKYREMHYFAVDYLDALKKFLTTNDLDNLEYFVSHNQWWDTIDKLDKIIGNIDAKSKKLDMLMIKWSKHENMWYRRLAIDHQQGRKEKTNEDLLCTIIVNNLGSDEFFINKAIGWSLREYSKVNPSFVKAFVEKYKDKMSNLSIKEASKRL